MALAGCRDRRGQWSHGAARPGRRPRPFRSCSVTGADPVKLGLVASLNRPGGNITGVTGARHGAGGEAARAHTRSGPERPRVARAPRQPGQPQCRGSGDETCKRRPGSLGLRLHVLHAGNDSRSRCRVCNFGSAARRRARWLPADRFFIGRSQQLAALAIRHAVPTIFQFRAFAAAGGLMSYGGSTTEPYRQAGVYAGRILKGEKPADLPVHPVDEGRAGDQSQDREDARPHLPADVARARRRGDRMRNRRELIALLGGVAVWPYTVRAQQPPTPVIGFLSGGSLELRAPLVAAFRQALERSRLRGGPHDRDRVPLGGRSNRTAAGAGGRSGPPAGRPDCRDRGHRGGARRKGRDHDDTNRLQPPAAIRSRLGLVASLSRPGGNVTGAVLLIPVGGEAVWVVARAGSGRGADRGPARTQPCGGAKPVEGRRGARLGQQIRFSMRAPKPRSTRRSRALTERRAGALLVGASPFFNSRRTHIVALAARHAVPAIYELREYALAGGLMSYGMNFADAYRQAGLYAGQISKARSPPTCRWCSRPSSNSWSI